MAGINTIGSGSVYPLYGPQTDFGFSDGAAPSDSVNGGPGDQEVAQAVSIGGTASPGIGLLVFGGLAVGVMAIAHHVGNDGEFANIKLTALNILVISLVAVAGIPVWKALFTKLKVPGVSTWVLSV